MILQYVEHLVAHVPAVLMPVIFLMSKAIVPPRQVGQVMVLNVRLLVPLKDLQLLCPAYIQPEQSETLLYESFKSFS